MAKKKTEIDDLYEIITGALPDQQKEQQEEVKEEAKQAAPDSSEIRFAFGVSQVANERKYQIVKIAYDLNTGYASIVGVVDEADDKRVAIVRAENKLREYIILGR